MKEDCMKKFLIVVCTFMGILSLVLSTAEKENIVIAEKGKAKAVVCIDEDASSQVIDAAKLLIDYLEESSGAQFPLSRGVKGERSIRIHVGLNDYTHGLDLNLKDMKRDGFVIAFPDEKNIAIVGPTDWGTEFGVYEFLERYAGVRWVMPGPHGDDVPPHPTLAISPKEVRQEPAYISRSIGGRIFARRNRMHSWITHGHNLDSLFPPSRYAETHPEFYPILDGERYIPLKEHETFTWQPCLSAEGIVEEAAQNIKAYFKNHPDATSFSLCMNDNNHFCECAECMEESGNKKNFLGYRDYSNVYFTWANEVVERVLEEYPDKWFGTYAYMGLAEPPSQVQEVHPRIVPFLTYGRHRWIDSEIREQGHRITERWNKSGATLGFYGYAWGYPYLLPRVWFHQMEENLRYGYEHGVRAYTAELFYNWGEGPKLYVALKLLWNPYSDVHELLDEWFVRTVGENAAPSLKAYYTHWETFWTERIFESSWYKREGMWLDFEERGYLDIVKEKDLEKSRQWMKEVVAKAKTSDQKARANILYRAFRLYEASVLSSIYEMRALSTHLNSEKEALEMLGWVEPYMKMKNRRWELVHDFDTDPILQDPNRQSGLLYRDLIGDRWGCYPLWKVYEWVKDKGSIVWDRVNDLTESPVEGVVPHVKLMKGLLQNKEEPVSKNCGFDQSVEDWLVTSGDREQVKWDAETGHRHPGSMCIEGPNISTVEQRVQVTQKPYTCVGFVKVPEDQPPQEVKLSLTIYSKKRQFIDEYSQALKPKPGEWTPLVETIDVIKEVESNRNFRYHMEEGKLIMVIEITAKGLGRKGRIHIDDLGLYAHER